MVLTITPRHTGSQPKVTRMIISANLQINQTPCLAGNSVYSACSVVFIAPPVQGAYEMLLQASLHKQDEEMHDRLGHTVLQAGAHNVVVALHKQPRYRDLHALLLAHALRHPEGLRIAPQKPGLRSDD